MLRLDKALFQRHLTESRSKAQHLIKAGVVHVNGQRVTQASYNVDLGDQIEIVDNPYPFVSRAGCKLARAAEVFKICFKGKVVLDVGASTGGFTDYALQNGARRVYAIDVGVNQLHNKLREDPRVQFYENTDVRQLTTQLVRESVDIITIDVSFISLKHIFPVLGAFLHQDSVLIVLIKPQFEAGPQLVSKGVVRSPRTHIMVLKKVWEYAIHNGLYVAQVTPSPYQGDAGNREFLALLTQQPCPEPSFTAVVEYAHQTLP